MSTVCGRASTSDERSLEAGREQMTQNATVEPGSSHVAGTRVSQSAATSALWTWWADPLRSRLQLAEMHVFAPKGPGRHDAASLILLHVPSCASVRLDRLAATVLQLSTADKPHAAELIRRIADGWDTETVVRALRNFDALLEELETARTPSPQPRSATRGELLLYGNLACNMSCDYCSSRHSRKQAEAGLS